MTAEQCLSRKTRVWISRCGKNIKRTQTFPSFSIFFYMLVFYFSQSESQRGILRTTDSIVSARTKARKMLFSCLGNRTAQSPLTAKERRTLSQAYAFNLSAGAFISRAKGFLLQCPLSCAELTVWISLIHAVWFGRQRTLCVCVLESRTGCHHLTSAGSLSAI